MGGLAPGFAGRLLIRFDAVSKFYPGPDGETGPDNPGRAAVRDLSFHIEAGELFGLIGSSGSGKTTSLKLANRLVEASQGVVWVAGRPVAKVDPVQLRRSMGYVIQQGGLFPHLSVAENLGLLPRLEGWAVSRRTRRMKALLAMVGLEPARFMDRMPSDLSGGEAQRVSVARALMLDPPILLMDEPFGALDPITRESLHREFLALKRELKKTIFLITHDLAEAFLLADRVGLMHEARLLQIGSEADFRERPQSAFVADFVQRHMEKPWAA